MTPLTLITTAVALALGLGAGLMLGRARRRLPDADWHTRIAARDRELHQARTEVADLAVALEEARARPEGPAPEAGTSAEVAAERNRAGDMAARLAAAEREVEALRSGGPNDGGAALARRVEELEAEMASLASHRCPDPGAHSGALQSEAATGP